MRRVVVHYHLFKNAGTSVDRALQAHFGAAWATQEGERGRWPAQAVTAYLAAHPTVRVLSSHTASLPVPKLDGAEIFPIIFLRHPIDRVRSMYDFEVRQSASTPGSQMAKRTDLAGYVRWRLERKGDRALRNFQSHRLSFAAEAAGREGERALAALCELPFFGLVEHFDASMARLEAYLAPAFPGFRAMASRANATEGIDRSLEERLAGVATALGPTLYRELLAANADDLAVHAMASALFAAGSGATQRVAAAE